MEGKIVLSLFDGCSGAQQVLEKAGVKVAKYFASEVDKYAIQATMAMYPNTIQLGDVRNVDIEKIGWVDYCFGGSPCQSFSFAGKRKGMSTKCEIEITKLEHYLQLKEENFEFEGQSYLFWEYVRILRDIRKINPDVKFLLENVEMGKKWERVLSEAIGVYGVHINSALVSAQNRKRIFWHNFKTKSVGLFGELHSDTPQPKDRGILLKDVLESDVDEKYYLSEKSISRILDYNNSDKMLNNDDKSQCLIAGYNKIGRDSTYIVVQRGRNPENPKSRVAGLSTEQMLEPRFDGKTNCLTSVQKDNYVMISNYIQWDTNVKNQKSQQDREFYIDGKMGCIPSSRTDSKVNILENDYRIRRLTPREVFRLQTFSEKNIDILLNSGISETQLYKMAGNGWNIDTVLHIYESSL